MLGVLSRGVVFRGKAILVRRPPRTATEYSPELQRRRVLPSPSIILIRKYVSCEPFRENDKTFIENGSAITE